MSIRPQIAINLEHYQPDQVIPMDFNLKKQTVCLAVINPESVLKEVELLLQTYLQTFNAQDSIALIVYVESVNWLIPALTPLLNGLNYQADNSPEMIILETLEAQEIPSLLAACDVFLHLSSGENLTSNSMLFKALCLNRQIITLNQAWVAKSGSPDHLFVLDKLDNLGDCLKEIMKGSRKKSTHQWFMECFYQPINIENPTLEQLSIIFERGQYEYAAQLAEKLLDSDQVSFDALFKCMQIFVTADYDQQASRVFERLETILAGIKEKFQIYLDPTQLVPYNQFICTQERAEAVYQEAFRRCFEYLQGSRMTGHILEFGTYLGYTARLMATLMKELNYSGTLYLYDSFQGLPPVTTKEDQMSYEVAEHHVWEQGMLNVPPTVPKQIGKTLKEFLPEQQFRIIQGFFAAVLPQQLPVDKIALAHIDCDLYASALCVLDQLLQNDSFQDGTLLIFDDFNCNHANPALGERKALQDAFAKQTRFSYSPFFSYGWHGQVFFVHDQDKY